MSIFKTPPLDNSTRVIEIPGSKSYTNRALIMAALTKGSVFLYNPLYSEDTEAMISCLRTLGLNIETLPDQIIVHDDLTVIQDKPYDLYVKDSGTTARFLLSLLTLVPGNKIIRGSARLNERPIKELVDALRLLGAKIHYLEREEELPLKVGSAFLLNNQEIVIDGSRSSQFFSSLLMIAPFLGGVTLHSQGNISKPYREMTLRAIEEWGIKVRVRKDGSTFIPPNQKYNKKEYMIEGDFSSAGYFFAIAALTQSTFTLKNLNPQSFQADKKFLNILTKMGNEVDFFENEITIRGKQILPISQNMIDCPDQIPTIAILAAFTKGISRISGIRSLRLKETDRVLALKNELTKMGIRIEESHDVLTIYGGDPKPSIIDTYGDHRMAMAFAVAKAKLPGLKIRNPEVVHKTFPAFWEKLEGCLK